MLEMGRDDDDDDDDKSIATCAETLRDATSNALIVVTNVWQRHFQRKSRRQALVTAGRCSILIWW